MTSRIGEGSCSTIPSSRLISVGVPQPSLTIGPKTKLFGAGGKIVRRSLMIFGAFSTGSFGKRIESIAPVCDPACERPP